MAEKLPPIPKEHTRGLGIDERAKENADTKMKVEGIPAMNSGERRRMEGTYLERELGYELLWGEANNAYKAEFYEKCGIPSHTESFAPSEQLIDAYCAHENRIREVNGDTRKVTHAEAVEGIKTAYKTQRETLDEWFSYFSESPHYSNWFRIYALNTIAKYTSFDTGAGEGKFKERAEYPFADYPSLNARILGEVHDILVVPSKHPHESEPDYEKRLGQHRTRVENFSFIGEMQRLTQQYGQMNLKFVEGLPLEMEPRVFKKTKKLHRVASSLRRLPLVSRFFSDTATELVNYLAQAGNPPQEPFPVEWCIAGIGHAESYLQTGDVHIYSTMKNGKHYPRLAVAFDEYGRVREVRGIERRQEIEEGIAEGVRTIVGALVGGRVYLRRIENVSRLNMMKGLLKKGRELSAADIEFLYRGSEHGTLQGLGYEREHPLVQVLLKERERQGKYESDIKIALSCLDEHLARDPSEVTDKTRIYIGALFPGMFSKIRPGVRIYTKYPSKKIVRRMVTTNIDASFAGSPPPVFNAVVLSLADLGLEKASIKDVYAKAKTFGLGYPPPVTRISEELNRDLNYALWGTEEWSLTHQLRTRRNVNVMVPESTLHGGSLTLVFRIL